MNLKSVISKTILLSHKTMKRSRKRMVFSGLGLASFYFCSDLGLVVAKPLQVSNFSLRNTGTFVDNSPWRK